MTCPQSSSPPSSIHQINNVLGQILAMAEAAWDTAGNAEATRRHLDALMERIEFASQLVSSAGLRSGGG